MAGAGHHQYQGLKTAQCFGMDWSESQGHAWSIAWTFSVVTEGL